MKKKEDWWWFNPKGQIVGPRPELIEEMYTRTKNQFYMYRVDPFMENTITYLTEKVNIDAIKEVKEMREHNEEILKKKLDAGRGLSAIPTTFADIMALRENAIKNALSSPSFFDIGKEIKTSKEQKESPIKELNVDKGATDISEDKDKPIK